MYKMNPATCSGCGLCQDVCDTKAVTISEMSKASSDIMLHSGQCSACGVAYHEPVADGGTLCAICRVTNHHKNLYLVLD